MKNLLASLGIALALLAPVVARANAIDPDLLHPGVSGEEMDATDREAYAAASADVEAALDFDFCSVIFIEADATHRWRAVCVLETEALDSCEAFAIENDEGKPVEFEVCVGPIASR
jgi:hypothetical protein